MREKPIPICSTQSAMSAIYTVGGRQISKQISAVLFEALMASPFLNA
jgi:hypothetical protein